MVERKKMKYCKPKLSNFGEETLLACVDGASAGKAHGCTTGDSVGDNCAYGASHAGFCWDGLSPSGWSCRIGGSPHGGAAPNSRCANGTVVDDDPIEW